MDELIWFGSENSFRELQALYGGGLNLTKAPDPKLWMGDDDRNPLQHVLADGVAVVDITGPMISRGNVLTKFFGIVDYESIKEKLVELGGDEDVRAIVMNYDTPGGAAKGCKLCARFIADFSANRKPVVSFTEGTAASAGYWLYAAGDQGVVDEEGRLGSIGAIIVHTEYTEMDKRLGITNTVLRSTPLKALGTPYEKLSDEAKKELEEELSYLHNAFATGISELRDLPKDEVLENIATGKVFRAQKALKLKLADHKLSLEQLVSRLSRQYRKPAPAESANKRK